MDDGEVYKQVRQRIRDGEFVSGDDRAKRRTPPGHHCWNSPNRFSGFCLLCGVKFYNSCDSRGFWKRQWTYPNGVVLVTSFTPPCEAPNPVRDAYKARPRRPRKGATAPPIHRIVWIERPQPSAASIDPVIRKRAG